MTKDNNSATKLSSKDKEEITDMFEGKFLIKKKSSEGMFIQWNDGGILYIRVKPKERIFK